MRIMGYCRVSTDEQAKSGLGMDDQRARLRAYCEMGQHDLVDVVEDEGVSGGIPLGERPGGSRLTECLGNGAADAVAILKLDRGFRDATDCLNTVDGWDALGVSLHILDLGGNTIDTRSAAGRFMLVVMAGAAEMERNLTRERTRAAMGRKRERGDRLGQVAYGIDSANNVVTENRDETAIIRRMAEMRAGGTSDRAIARALNDEGVSTKLNKKWHGSSVAGILRRAGSAPQSRSWDGPLE